MSAAAGTGAPGARVPSGRLVMRGEAGFEEAVLARLFNAMRPDRRPAAVLLAENDADVVAGVGLARERGWRVAVRSGGHSWPAWSVREGTLLIDLADLNSIAADPAARLVDVGPAATGSQLLEALAPHGLMFQTGHAPGVGLGGYLLQGGGGWCTRGWGWACEQIVELDVVCADGRLRTVDAERDPDLLWAARGAGHGFCGIVTRFRLRARPLPGAIWETALAHPIERFDAVMAWALEHRASIDPQVEFGVLGTCDPVESTPAIILFAIAFTDSGAEARAVLAPFAGSPFADRARRRLGPAPTSLLAQMNRVGEANPGTLRCLADSAWTAAEPGETTERMRRAFTELPTPESESLWLSFASPRSRADMALSLQTDSYFATFPRWRDPAQDADVHRWLAERMAEVDPVSVGTFIGDSDVTRREAPLLGAAARRRLERVRAVYDPADLFCNFMTRSELAAGDRQDRPGRADRGIDPRPLGVEGASAFPHTPESRTAGRTGAGHRDRPTALKGEPDDC